MQRKTDIPSVCINRKLHQTAIPFSHPSRRLSSRDRRQKHSKISANNKMITIAASSQKPKIYPAEIPPGNRPDIKETAGDGLSSPPAAVLRTSVLFIFI